MIKELAIKLHLWDADVEGEVQKVVHEVRQEAQDRFVTEARKHYCALCTRWFEKYSGMKAHMRWKHKNA